MRQATYLEGAHCCGDCPCYLHIKETSDDVGNDDDNDDDDVVKYPGEQYQANLGLLLKGELLDL